MSNQQLLDGYFKLSNPQALKDYYLKTLRDRAKYGNSDAKRIGSVWKVDKDGATTYIHPTQKPVALAEEAIDKTTKKGYTVLDLFGGSGSTLIACEKTGRKARLMELDEKYVDVIIKRWQTYTGKQAIHIDSGKTYDELAGDSNAAITD